MSRVEDPRHTEGCEQFFDASTLPAPSYLFRAIHWLVDVVLALIILQSTTPYSVHNVSCMYRPMTNALRILPVPPGLNTYWRLGRILSQGVTCTP